jgi:hypothetical protein
LIWEWLVVKTGDSLVKADLSKWRLRIETTLESRRGYPGLVTIKCEVRKNRVLSRTSHVLCREEDAATQEIEAGASVHPSLDQPKTVGMTLRLSAASGHDKSGFARRFTLL